MKTMTRPEIADLRMDHAAGPAKRQAVTRKGDRQRFSLKRALRQAVGWWGTPDRLFAMAAAVYLLLAVLAFLVVRPTVQLYFTDYWEHRAIINEVIRGGTHLLDPIYGEAASSRQFTPWSLALGYLARVGHLDVDAAMAWGAMLVSVLFVIGVRDFASVYYTNRWAPVLLLAALTCGWGLPPLIWTGFYALRSQLHGNYYPAALVFSLTFVAWAQVVRLLRGAGIGLWRAALLWTIVACSLVTHPLNAAFLIAGAVALAMFEDEVRVRRRIAVGLVMIAAIISTSLWPYFNPLSLAGVGLARGQQTFNNFGFFYSPFFVITLAWPAMFALLAAPGLVRDRRARMPVIALVSIFAAYVAGGIADISVSHRFLAYVILALQILLVRALVDVIDGRPPRLMNEISARGWRIASIGASLLVLGQIALAAEQLIHPWAKTDYLHPVHPVDAEMRSVHDAFPADARVLGWDSAALVLPAYGVRVVAFPRPMPLSPSDMQRQADYRRFFTRGLSTRERRIIAGRWGTTHIAYLGYELPKGVQLELDNIGYPASRTGPWVIIKIAR